MVYLGPGNYVVVVYPEPSNYNACLSIIGPSQGLAMGGLASLPNNPISTGEVLGYFSISSISAYNSNASQYGGAPSDGASLQLGAVIVLQLADGSIQYYLAQDILRLETQGGYYSVADVVWNETTAPSVLNGVAGNGGVTAYGADEAYEYSTPFSTYKLPLSGYLIIGVAASGGGSAVIGFGYAIIQSGAYRPPQVVWFDNVTIMPDSPVVSAFIEAYNGRLTGSGRPMSMELTFGGYGIGEATTFNNLSAELALAYWNGSGWVSPPSIYDYSLNPVGSATDLKVLMQGALAMVSTGRPDPGLLSPQPPAPALPMTYIAVYNSVTNSLNATYVTQPVTVSQPQVIYVGQGARYVLTGYYVNDEFTANPPVIEPGTWFATYEVEAQYQEEYLVSIVSPLPLAVNGTETTNYTAWVVAGSLLNLAIGDVYLANNTMYTPSIGNESIIVSSPINLSISWTPNYLVSVESVLPIYVNGSEVINYANWLARGGSILLIEANNVVLGNGTMFKPSISNETITVNSPTTISITWTPYYLVSIVSPVPVRVNGGEATTNYTAWLRPGSTVVVNASVVFLGNGTMLMPSVGNESLTVNSPINLAMGWTPYYLVNITGEYPVRVNGTLTRVYSAYVRAGSVLVVRAEPVVKYLGLVVMRPNATSLVMVVNRPVRLFIAYTPNYANLLLLMLLIALALAVVLMTRRLGHGESWGEEVQL